MKATPSVILSQPPQVLGAQYLYTLGTADGLARSLSKQEKYAEAETMQRELLAAQQRVLGN